MTYKGPGGFGRIVNIIMNIFMCATFSFFMLWSMQQRAGDMAQILTPLGFVVSFIISFGIGFTTADLIPVFAAGSSVARKFNLKGAAAYFVTVVIIDLITTTIISFFMCFINMMERAGFMGTLMTWIQLYPIMLLLGLIVQLIVMKPAMAFAKAATGFDPENPMPPMGIPPASMPPVGGPPAGMPPVGGPPAGGPPVGGPPAGMPPVGGPPAGGPPAGMPPESTPSAKIPSAKK